ncbi:MAG: hypothetical protein IT281_06590 [Ignavibacteria bacterium]|nr:hypothetical protein [Ignavibacteria bacterium]
MNTQEQSPGFQTLEFQFVEAFFHFLDLEYCYCAQISKLSRMSFSTYQGELEGVEPELKAKQKAPLSLKGTKKIRIKIINR